MSDTTESVVGHYWDTVIRYWRRIVHHWQGRYPLSQSFWFNYLSVSTCLLLRMIWCLIVALLFDYPYFDRLLIACAVLQSSVWIWALVGTLRSARNDVGGIASSLRRFAANAFLIMNMLSAIGCAAIATVYISKLPAACIVKAHSFADRAGQRDLRCKKKVQRCPRAVHDTDVNSRRASIWKGAVTVTC